MMIYLTGATSSLAKSQENPQTDSALSLGGYISSSPVPNAAINVLFDAVSSYTLDKRLKETIAIGLINKFDTSVENVELKIVTEQENEAEFRIAAVSVGENYSMEHIANRYQEPMIGEFHDASFHRASVDLEITNHGVKGEEIVFYPFNVVAEIQKNGIEGTWEAIEEAFNSDENYSVSRISEKIFRIGRRDENVLENPVRCSYIATENFSANFLGEMSNKINKTVLVSDGLKPNEAIGIWIQRVIKKSKFSSNETILQNFKNGNVRSEIENIELVISYNLGEKTDNYDKNHYDEQYS